MIDAMGRKLLRLKPEKRVESNVLTLMVTDMQRVSQAFSSLHDLWGAPVDTAIATCLLWRQVGPSSLTVLGVTFRRR